MQGVYNPDKTLVGQFHTQIRPKTRRNSDCSDPGPDSTNDISILQWEWFEKQTL